MQQLIDQVIAALLATPDTTRRGHPLLAAITATFADSPDDQADLERFVARPQRYESVLRGLLAERLPQDAVLQRSIVALLAGETDAPEPALPAATGGDDIQVGDIREATGIAIGAGARSTVLQLFFSAAGIADPSEEQRELVASYLARLASRCDRLRLSGAVRRERRDAGPTLTLSQVYVALASESWQPLREADHAEAFARELKAGDPDDVLPEAVRRVVELQREGELARTTRRGAAASNPRFRLERPLLLTEALSRHKQLVLLGGPGSGKSSFLRHLAVALARAEDADLPGGWSAGRLLPLYASLGAFAAWTQQPNTGSLDGPSLWRYLLAMAQEYGLDGLDEPLKRAFRQGGLLLLLDGLDEVADPLLRAGVARAVAALAEAGGYVAVTCRVRSFEGAVAEPFANWGAPATLAPFSLGQMRHFVEAWYLRSAAHGAIDGDEAGQRVQELTDRLVRLPNLRDLGQTPLLLTIMTILHYYEGKLPEDRADLYEDLVQLLLTRWTVQRREAGAPPPLLDQLKEDKSLGGLKEFHLRNALEGLAYRAHQESPSSDGRGLLDRHRVRGAFDDLFAEFEIGAGPAAEKAEQVLRHLEHESGLLLPEGGDLYGLPHLSYEEYLAGCYLSRQADFRTRAYGLWQSDAGRWREVIFLALGRMVRGEGREAAAGWLAFLLAPLHGERVRETAELQRAAFFAYECLEQMGGKAALIGASTVSLPELWEHLAGGLAAVVEGAALPAADRVQAGVWLGELGDPRIPVTSDEWQVASSPTAPSFSSLVTHHSSLTSYWRTIPGSSFVVGLTPKEIRRLPKGEQGYFSDTKNEVSVSIAGFELARYPVTNAQYAMFIEDGGYDPAAPWWDEAARAWLGRDDAATEGLESWQRREHKDQPEFWDDATFGSARPNYPVVGVSWYEAMAFCRWLTQWLSDSYMYVLPSEAEWEYAARGAERRMYPWPDAAEPGGERANFNQMYNSTIAVGCFPQGETPEGVLDLAGNVLEWTRSEYRDYPYDSGDGREEERDPAQKRFTLRGGSWLDPSVFLRAAYRDLNSPDVRNVSVGFRLARHPKV
jgi:formylglycine-generating enzyme required for sulfatase activity